jgi:hypothetical protein
MGDNDQPPYILHGVVKKSYLCCFVTLSCVVVGSHGLQYTLLAKHQTILLDSALILVSYAYYLPLSPSTSYILHGVVKKSYLCCFVTLSCVVVGVSCAVLFRRVTYIVGVSHGLQYTPLAKHQTIVLDSALILVSHAYYLPLSPSTS